MLFLSIIAGLLAFTAPASACGPDSDCAHGERHYRIRMPEGHDGARIGALVYAHGYRGSAQGAMRNGALESLARDLGVALIAAKSAGADWAIPGVPSHSEIPGADELAYFDAVIADATARFPIDPERIVVAGFSAGGMMVWNLICYRGDRFAGFIPMAGTFWRPEPERCPSPPARVVHIHGDADRIVPLGGRPIGSAHQGDVPRVLATYAAQHDLGPPRRTRSGDLLCEERTGPGGALLSFCQFPGGHAFRTSDLRYAWERLAAE